MWCCVVIAVRGVERDCIASLHDGLPDIGMPSLLSGDCGAVMCRWLKLVVGDVVNSRSVGGFC